MSGFVGIVMWDGTPVCGRLLRQMTDAMADRGPDGRDVRVNGPVGLGHTLLRTTEGAGDDGQPASLDGTVWLVADARVDGRADLIRQLESSTKGSLATATDAHLILHAYQVWGERCVEHLIGDFAFAIWDGHRRRMFCARDHFGIKPFYYATVPGGIVFSNTLDCIRLHSGVGDALNEIALGDFLLFGSNQEPTTTIFAGIQRLAPAHALSCENGTNRSTRYWALPTDGRIRYRRSHDYVEHFTELLQASVADRLRMRQIGVWMSGGIDSTSITATAHRLLSRQGAAFDLRAHTVVYDTLIPDCEREYARAAAESVGLTTTYFPADRYEPFEGWQDAALRRPEPTDDPFLKMRIVQLSEAAAHTRVMLCGEGGDEVFWRSDVADLFGKMPLADLGADIARSLIVHHRRPALGVRARFQRALGRRAAAPGFPAWLKTSFIDRTNLRARWAQMSAPVVAREHARRPEAHRRLATAPWTWYFESLDPGVTRIPVEARYPFLDLRLVHYLLALPPFPWFINKHLLRVAMCGSLPDRVRLRPKAALPADPLRAQLVRSGTPWWARCDLAPELRECVDQARIPRMDEGYPGQDPWLDIRPACLSFWLKGMHVHAG